MIYLFIMLCELSPTIIINHTFMDYNNIGTQPTVLQAMGQPYEVNLVGD